MAEEIYQVFVKLLDGKSKALNFPSTSSISPLSIKRRLSSVTGIPISDQILVSGTKTLSDGPHKFPIFCSLLVPLRGGKGGFGSLLRGAATKAGQKKTNNFDACRDMSGRRLRHVNAERRLEEWAAEAEERELERAAEQFLSKKAKAEGRIRKAGGGAETDKYVSKYREDSARCMEVMEKSVREALGKKRKAKAGPGGDGLKKLKIWMGKRKVDNSDSDGTDEDDSDDNEEEDNENSVVLDNENHLDLIEEPEGSSDSVTGGKVDGNSSAGGSSENSSDGDEETAVRETSINVESPGEAMVEETVLQNGAVSLLEATVFSETVAVKTENVMVDKPPTISSSGEGETLELGTTDAEMSLSHVPKPVVEEEIVAKSTDDVDLVKPLNFEEFNSSAELEVMLTIASFLLLLLLFPYIQALGMEKLKSELQLWGLKCGGTLQERAARLFLLKTTPLEKLPKKLLAKK